MPLNLPKPQDNDGQRKQLAKNIVAALVRNSAVLEDAHAKSVPITQEVMKALMKDFVNRAYTWLYLYEHDHDTWLLL